MTGDLNTFAGVGALLVTLAMIAGVGIAGYVRQHNADADGSSGAAISELQALAHVRGEALKDAATELFDARQEISVLKAQVQTLGERVMVLEKYNVAAVAEMLKAIGVEVHEGNLLLRALIDRQGFEDNPPPPGGVG